jgi:hypothetical protein
MITGPSKDAHGHQQHPAPTEQAQEAHPRLSPRSPDAGTIGKQSTAAPVEEQDAHGERDQAEVVVTQPVEDDESESREALKSSHWMNAVCCLTDRA